MMFDLPDEPSIARAIATGYPWDDREESGLVEDDDSDYAYEAERDKRLEDE